MNILHSPSGTGEPTVVITRVAEGQWHALEEDLVVGRGDAVHRPDGRLFLSVDAWHTPVFDRLAAAMLADLPRPLYTVVDAADLDSTSGWQRAGFTIRRREWEYEVPTDPRVTGLDSARPPSGVTLVLIRKSFAERSNKALPVIFRYPTHIEAQSLYNTPPCFGIYVLMLVTRWIKKMGLEHLYKQNVDKAAMLYKAIDATDFYRGTAVVEDRSDMNVTFRLPTEELEDAFCSAAKKVGLDGLKGHRSVGGLRASIYNAFPVEGVRVLVDFMKEFERTHG